MTASFKIAIFALFSHSGVYSEISVNTKEDIYGWRDKDCTHMVVAFDLFLLPSKIKKDETETMSDLKEIINWKGTVAVKRI